MPIIQVYLSRDRYWKVLKLCNKQNVTEARVLQDIIGPVIDAMEEK